MRPLRSLAIYFAAVFIGGALLAPWLYFCVRAVAPHSVLAGHPFHRYLDRALLGVALVGLWPLLGKNGMRSWRQVGVFSWRGRGPEFARAFYLGWAILLAAFVPAILCRGRLPVFSHARPAGYFTGAILTAIFVSAIEELLFRGALFGLLRQAMHWRAAALVSSLIYAFSHFLQKADLSGPITWSSGLRLLPPMARSLADVHSLFPAFLNLTLIGVALAVLYQRTGALYASFALHASLIFWLRFFQFFTEPAPHSRTWLWGGENPLTGWLGAPLLAAALCLAFRLAPDKTDA